MQSYTAVLSELTPDAVTRYELLHAGRVMSWSDVLRGWQSDPLFREWFADLLRASPFDGFRWETPPVSSETTDSPFEFVLRNSPEFCRRRTDSRTFAQYFTRDDSPGIVSFPNPKGDTLLIVPSPRTDDHACYGHLAAFLRKAPRRQADALWSETGRLLTAGICAVPCCAVLAEHRRRRSCVAPRAD